MTTREPLDEAALYNPAFLATVVSVAAKEYEHKRGTPMPLALAFAIAPLVLASDSRYRLLRRTDAYLANWLSADPASRAENRIRTRAMTRYTRRGIRFGLRYGHLEFAGDAVRGRLIADETARGFEGEAAAIVKSASFVGRWFAREETAQVYALLGIRP